MVYRSRFVSAAVMSSLLLSQGAWANQKWITSSFGAMSFTLSVGAVGLKAGAAVAVGVVSAVTSALATYGWVIEGEAREMIVEYLKDPEAGLPELMLEWIQAVRGAPGLSEEQHEILQKASDQEILVALYLAS